MILTQLTNLEFHNSPKSVVEHLTQQLAALRMQQQIMAGVEAPSHT